MKYSVRSKKTALRDTPMANKNVYITTNIKSRTDKVIDIIKLKNVIDEISPTPGISGKHAERLYKRHMKNKYGKNIS